ncbi:MAG: TetR/AcrR family transcriptional regulator [Rikenellaceae bacterium]
MTQTGLRKPRRTKAQLEEDLLNGLERLVAKMGFTNIPLYMITQEADIDSNVFYRRYKNVNELFALLAHRYDSWINELITPKDIELLGERKALINMLQKGFYGLSNNRMMQRLLVWELSDSNEVTRQTAAARLKSMRPIIKRYSDYSRGKGVDMKSSISILICALFYMVLRRSIFISSQATTPNTSFEDREILSALEMMVNLLFDRMERNQKLKNRITMMLDDGISPENIQRYLEITSSEYEFAMA